MSSAVKVGSVFSAFILLLAYFYRQQTHEILQDELNKVLQGLIRAEEKVQVTNNAKVAVGFGACLDYVADGLEVLSKINAEVPRQPEHFNKISSLEDLTKAFAYFFKHGAAAE